MRYVVGLFFILLSIFLYVFLKPIDQLPSQSIPNPSPSITQVFANTQSISGLFVPYWTLSSALIHERYDELYYFGIAPSSNGSIMPEIGKNNTSHFLENSANDSKKLLVIRMLERDINSLLLEDSLKQNTFIQESTDFAKKNNFDGIVLDFEYKALSFDTTIARITRLYQNFSKVTHKKQMLFYVAVYGDTLYRVRPYDIKKIGEISDRVLIMVYDFHKSRGNAGPTFPLFGKEQYGYDLSVMVDDFLLSIANSKITIVFGMFGYDWVEGGSDARPITTSQALVQFFNNCELKACHVNTDKKSMETHVNYIDENNKAHTVWFETLSSVKKKQEYLKSRGISSFAYWAYSYF